MTITGDTVTDAQIRELLDSIPANSESGGFQWQRRRMCEVALGIAEHVVIDRAEARARIADVIRAKRFKCPANGHRHHIGDICNGSCCTACGGPIDDDGGCRCPE